MNVTVGEDDRGEPCNPDRRSRGLLGDTVVGVVHGSLLLLSGVQELLFRTDGAPAIAPDAAEFQRFLAIVSTGSRHTKERGSLHLTVWASRRRARWRRR